ncbi:MAG TPA: ester cyclase [Verrucomicrobiae bacterium]|nr:ester cyclase [Verrucomicrobiae bacterium]
MWSIPTCAQCGLIVWRFLQNKTTLRVNPMKSKTLAHEWFEEVWNKSQITAIDRLLAKDAIAHGLFDEHGHELRGPAGFKPFFLQFTKAFPDIHVEVADTVSEGDKIAARCVVRGTHKGDMLGVPASHKPIEFTGITILRVKEGKIVEAWNNFDFQRLSKQIGALVQAGR